MKLQVRIALVLTVALLIVLLLLLCHKPEPKHNGKPLSEWLTQLVVNYPRMDGEAVLALNAMGEEAVRCLVETVEDEDSPLTTRLLEYSDKLPLLADVLPSKAWGQFVALKALAEMRTNAASAIPSLQRLAAVTNDYMLAPAARAALVLIQNDSIEALADQVFDGDRTNSSPAFGVLLALGPRGKPAIPRVLNELQSTNEGVRLRSAIILQHIGIESPECVPAFTNMLTDPNHLMHRLGITALANSGNLATSSAPAVVELLEDSESNCRHAVLEYLWRAIPPESFGPFRSGVQKMVRDSDPNVRESAGQLLITKQQPAK